MYFLYYILICGNVIHEVQPSKPYKFSFGPIETSYQIGTLSDRYTPLSSQDQNAIANIQDLIEEQKNLRDPYRGKNFPAIVVDDLSLLVSGNIYLKSLNVTGVKNIQIHSLEVRMKTLRIDIDVEVPVLEGSAKTETDLTISAVIPVSVDVNIKARIRTVKLKVAAQFKEKNIKRRDVYQLTALQFVFHADSVDAIASSKNIDDSLMDILKSFTSSSERTIEITRNYIAKEAIRRVNKMLKKFSTDQIKETFFKSGSS